MIVKRAENSDAEALAKLARETYSAAFGHSLSAADLAAHLETHLSPVSLERILDVDTVLVAQIEGRMVGFIQFGAAAPSSEGAPSGDQVVRRLYVHAKFQNRGIGTLLMDTALDHPSLGSAARVFLDVWEHNHGARRFYERYGFRVVGERPFDVASGAETSLDLIMVRRGSG